MLCAKLLTQITRNGSEENVMTAENITQAHQIWPPIFQKDTRKEIDLTGVPGSLAEDYRKALKALAEPELYEFANVLARRSLETILMEKGYEGKNLRSQIESLQNKKPPGIPGSITENLDAIRTLGNWGAHRTDDKAGTYIEASIEETEWNITLWERVMIFFYVEPEQDKTHKDRINSALSQAGRRTIT